MHMISLSIENGITRIFVYFAIQFIPKVIELVTISSISFDLFAFLSLDFMSVLRHFPIRGVCYCYGFIVRYWLFSSCFEQRKENIKQYIL
jgi:hypothetical protein